MLSSSWRMELVLKALNSSTNSNRSLFRTEDLFFSLLGRLSRPKLSALFGKCFGWGSLHSRIIFLSLGSQHPMTGSRKVWRHSPLTQETSPGPSEPPWAGHSRSLVSSSVPSCSVSSHTPELLVAWRAWALINLPNSPLHFTDYFLGDPQPMAAGREELVNQRHIFM